jgi:hypothetical protein
MITVARLRVIIVSGSRIMAVWFASIEPTRMTVRRRYFTLRQRGEG